MSKLREAIQKIVAEEMSEDDKLANPDKARMLRCASTIGDNAHQISQHLMKELPAGAYVDDMDTLISEIESMCRVMRRSAAKLGMK